MEWAESVKIQASPPLTPFLFVMKFPASWALADRMIGDTTTLARFIQACAKNKRLSSGKLLHSRLICAGYQPCTFIANHLIIMYAKCGGVENAFNLFDQMPQRNLFSWTSLISGFSQSMHLLEAMETFCKMRIAGENPNQFAFSSVILASSYAGSMGFSKQVHGLALKSGFNRELYTGSNLADMYSKSGAIYESCLVFEEMTCKDEVLWTTMINGYAKNGNNVEALAAFRSMVQDDIGLDKHVFCSTLSACSNPEALGFGKSVHSSIIKTGFESETPVRNALTDMYSKAGDMQNALRVFRIQSNGRDIISFTSLIDGYVEAGQIEAAVIIFIDLLRLGVDPSQFTFSSLIKACANHGALEQGMQFHSKVLKLNFDKDMFVSSTLVYMYGKCGMLEHSVQAFHEIANPSEVAYNSLLRIYAQHGFGNDVISIFEEMVIKGVKPSGITFVSLLMGCSHAGLVDEGLQRFHSMDKIYGVAPREEHYTCIVDLLCRGGRLKDAEEFINDMPYEANAFAWSSFLGACKTHGDIERGKIAAENLLRIDPENSGAHVLLSNMYAVGRKWEDVRHVRKVMRNENVKKMPGCSWVVVGSKTHFFGAEDHCHPQAKAIYEKLDGLLDEIKAAGYVPSFDSIPFEMEEVTKEKLLHHHSERIAIAFALIGMPSGKPIIVMKNIRVCMDCHSAIKFISKVAGRKIIIRDNTRFHHFVDGSCSCGDYW